MQFIRGAAVCGVIIAALVAGGPAAGAAPVAGPGNGQGAGPVSTAVSTAGVAATTGSRHCGSLRPPRHLRWLDGFALRWVPPGIGPLVTDFAYEWDDVGFRSRVWESGPYPDESYRVDLQVTVMRSPSFTDVAALRGFLAGYLERDPAAWATEPFDHPDGPGFLDVGELFWLAAPGVAVRVLGGGEQVDLRDLTRTACAVRQVMPMR
ncbi:hypothetical protein E1212_03285 [Jiangella ureilytica]|uniref:DUF3558 domain-containing protein n=1 Tax=Jiangella ureilytica TaxID=2530374 RepID=A0A4R4RVJ3_9ACTN|nr:hypothetical protein [Jiangella ureilytica]TDC54171.1 hypothetical protein E1212_03285 [Jiangella ureilytica]